ncbi:MAG: 2-methylaconitate cis-trans isomerase PrpF [Segniliparus sp.]|uniref:2-methylaconitate cis-trans isomerase PrpF n=1 Tax=Segniliparus sp. TaxID=2804064 RepID=UPI003F2C3DCA
MSDPSQIRIPATYMRGGTSKGVFFRLDDLPEAARRPGEARDRLLLRALGSPDPYGKQTDGMGGATSSTSKAVIVSRSERPGHDVDYLFGQVAIDRPFVDWSGNCGNLTSAVGPFAVANGLVAPERVPQDGVCAVRIWQANTGKTIVAHVPVAGGAAREAGDFELDGVAFPAAETRLEFLDPADSGALFPSGRLVDELDVPGVGRLRATLVDAGIPLVLVDAGTVGLTGTELQDEVDGDAGALRAFESIRAHGAVRMGLISRPEEAAARQHTPKIAFLAPPKDYTASSGKAVAADAVDLLVRVVAMGKLHHAVPGTAAVALAAAAAVPGTVASDAAGVRSTTRIGHPSGTMEVGVQANEGPGGWAVAKAVMSRSARVLMDGHVHLPPGSF